jgi:hypothetical protein
LCLKHRVEISIPITFRIGKNAKNKQCACILWDD